MAASGKKSCKEAFGRFATKDGGKAATSKDMTKMCQDAGVFGKLCTSNNLDICFSGCKTKGKPNITLGEFDAFLDKVSQSYCKDKKLSDSEGNAEFREKISCAEPKAHGATKQSKTGGVEKMTDTSKYTGAHKERFDASGKGKGVEGREDRQDNTGYTGQYKGADTFDKK